MINMLSIIRRLPRRNKVVLIMFVDFLLAFACWIVFGPPLTAIYATNINISLITKVLENLNSKFKKY